MTQELEESFERSVVSAAEPGLRGLYLQLLPTHYAKHTNKELVLSLGETLQRVANPRNLLNFSDTAVNYIPQIHAVKANNIHMQNFIIGSRRMLPKIPGVTFF